jgi:peptidoglycan/LPS O-acetylase OafA/YrhL
VVDRAPLLLDRSGDHTRADPLIIAVATGRAAALTRLLDTRPLRETGPDLLPPLLIHLPILAIRAKKVAPHHVEKGPHTYAFLVLAGAPLALLVAWLFANVFEFPFQRHRSWRSVAAGRRPTGAPDDCRAAGRAGRQPGRSADEGARPGGLSTLVRESAISW